ncbi:MAG: S8 family serine peptidase [Solirubrobacterales bacterium]
MHGWRVTFLGVVAGLLVLCVVTPGARSDPAPKIDPGPTLPPSEYPNDPDFAGCETQDPVTGCTDNEQWNLYGRLTGDTCLAPGGSVPDQPHPDGGLPCWARNAHDPGHAAGVNMTGAWAQGNLGRGDVVIAYIEGGVNYSSNGIKDGLDNIYLNRGELPFPQRRNGQDTGRYDLDGNGRFDIRDYAFDPRVNPRCPTGTTPFTRYEEGTTRGCVSNGQHAYLDQVDIGGVKTAYLSPEDLIAVFGHCRVTGGHLGACPAGGRFDNDGNGYPNDISGWNVQRNTNDPQTDDSAYNHAPGLISDLVGQSNNDYGGVGVCRKCRVMPIKQGAEAVGRSDQLAPAILYATDAGASVISSVVVSYTYTDFARQAIDYANSHGVLLSFDSNDFDSMDHTDGMLYDHVLPGNSLTQDAEGPDTHTFRARSNVTSYGTHNVFSGEGNSTSGATPFQAGMLAMVQSAALNARDAGTIPRRLTPNEVRQVMMDTASAVIPQTQSPGVPRQWPGNPGSATSPTHTNWSTQYGYGRPNIGAATALIKSGEVPPTAELSSPHWYAYVDPVRQRTLRIRGHVAPSAWRSKGVHWTLEFALGANPNDGAFQTISTGRGAKSGELGVLDLNRIRRQFAAKSPGSTLPPDGPEQYTVTLRLRAHDGDGLKGEDRRTFNARHDPDLLPGYPKHIGAEMSAAPTYADLAGKHELDLIFGTYDGTIHALRPNGSEVPGFPIHTRTLASIDPLNPENYPAASYQNDAKLRDARDPVSGIAVGDLDHNGVLDVVATTANAWVYAWGPNGQLRKGFPAHSQSKFASLPVPTPRSSSDHSRLPSRGNWSPPVLADLRGDGKLEILMSAFDGFVYAWGRNGRPVPGWPVQVKLPPADLAGTGPNDYIRDAKLTSPPAVGDVLGTGKPQVFVPSNECLSGGGAHRSWMYGIWPDGNRHPGGPYMPEWPVGLTSLADCYDQSIDFVEEGATPASIADFDGSGRLRVVTAGVTGAPVALNGDGSVFKGMSPGCPSSACGPVPPYYPGDALTIGLTGQSAIGDLLGDGSPEYVQSQTGANSLTAALGDSPAALPQTYEKAWNVASGAVLSGFPRLQDGFPFYVAPLVAGLDSSQERAVVDANDSGWIHAYEPAGGEAPGFPKFTGQWPSFSGVVGDPRFDGKLRLAYGTREGLLFVWKVHGSSSRNDSWWHYHHDEHNSGLFGNDTRRPAALAGIHVTRDPSGATLHWRAPGDDGVTGGRVHGYQVYVSQRRITIPNLDQAHRLKAPAPTQPGGPQQLTIPGRGGVFVAIRAIDDAENLSALAEVYVPTSSG